MHAHGLAPDLQPLLRRWERTLQGGSPHGRCQGVVRVARRSQRRVAATRVLEDLRDLL